MKQIVLTILMVALLAIGASAIQISNPTLGGEKQDRVKNVATTFTITNNNTATFTNIAISAGAGANNAKYALSFSGIPASLGPGASISITVNGTIPLDHPGVDSDLTSSESRKHVSTVIQNHRALMTATVSRT